MTHQNNKVFDMTSNESWIFHFSLIEFFYNMKNVSKVKPRGWSTPYTYQLNQTID
jgi:hypothetical protein